MTTSVKRVLAIVDFDTTGEQVARAARRIASEQNSQLALGHVLHWDRSNAAELSQGVLYGEAMDSLRPVQMSRLRRLAKIIGHEGATPLVVRGESYKRGLERLVASWIPDVMVVHQNDAVGMIDGCRFPVHLPFVSAAPMVRMVRAEEPEPELARSLFAPLWGWLRH
jgi:uncharacterized protein YcsI (UPF0317 family)